MSYPVVPIGTGADPYHDSSDNSEPSRPITPTVTVLFGMSRVRVPIPPSSS